MTKIYKLNNAPKKIKNAISKLDIKGVKTICRGAFSESNRETMIELMNERPNDVLILFDKKILGFAIITEQYKNIIYISYVCSNTKGGGRQLFTEIKKEAINRNRLKLKGISRGASIGFWKKMGMNIPNRITGNMEMTLSKKISKLL